LVVLACKHSSALEEASEGLPAGEPPPKPHEVRAKVNRDNAARARDARAQPGTNQIGARGASSTGSASGPGPAPAPTPTPAPADTSAAPWASALVEFDGALILLRGRVDFEDDHTTISGDGRRVLDDVARLLDERPGIASIEVQAHRHDRMKATDRPTQRRADAVRAYLIERGVAEARVVARGYEAEMPIDTNRTEDGRQANTRVEILVTSLR
jgi:outer membrane protein OmpA-like peptidoglycan-associated protein